MRRDQDRDLPPSNHVIFLDFRTNNSMLQQMVIWINSGEQENRRLQFQEKFLSRPLLLTHHSEELILFCILAYTYTFISFVLSVLNTTNSFVIVVDPFLSPLFVVPFKSGNSISLSIWVLFSLSKWSNSQIKANFQFAFIYWQWKLSTFSIEFITFSTEKQQPPLFSHRAL